MVKRLISIIIIMVMVLSLTLINASETISVLLNGNAVEFDQPPIIENDRTLVPMRAIFEAIGARVDWDENLKTVTATKLNITVKLKIGDTIAYKNGQKIVLDAPANIVNGRTLVPVRFVAESMGAIVEWDSETSTVIIKYESNKIFGVDFGPYIDGQDPNTGAVVSEEQFKERLKIISPYVNWIRTFGSTDGGLANAGKIAHDLNIKIAQGCWLSTDKTANNKEIDNLINAAKAGNVDIAIVGSETLYRGDLDENVLIEYINTVKSQLPPNVMVTTADVYDQLLKNPKVIEAVDVILVNYYPFLEGIDVANCMVALDTMYNTLLSSAQGKEIIISETSYPSNGSKKINAIPSLENASKYFAEFIEWANKNNVKYFYFEAFDEAWKSKYEGDVGAHWGIFTTDGKLKPGMDVGLKIGWKNSLKFKDTASYVSISKGSTSGTIQIRIRSKEIQNIQYKINNGPYFILGNILIYWPGSNSWTVGTDNIKVSPGDVIQVYKPEDEIFAASEIQTFVVTDQEIKEIDKPEIKLTYIPQKGEASSLKGQVNGLDDYSEYRIVLYILVDGSYWIKPYADYPLTIIDGSGKFSVSYNTGGNDINVTEFDVFLIKKEYSPPKILGQSTLPDELYKNAIASVVGRR